MNASNKGVQGTRHKVPGPLTPDVGTRIYMATARTMDLRPLRRNDHDRAGMIWEAKPGTANENGCQQDVPPYAAQGAPKVNFNVGSEYMATARPMDPPQERCEPRRPRGNDFGLKPGTADE